MINLAVLVVRMNTVPHCIHLPSSMRHTNTPIAWTVIINIIAASNKCDVHHSSTLHGTAVKKIQHNAFVIFREKVMLPTPPTTSTSHLCRSLCLPPALLNDVAVPLPVVPVVVNVKTHDLLIFLPRPSLIETEDQQLLRHLNILSRA